jgi:hypothetical protein
MELTKTKKHNICLAALLAKQDVEQGYLELGKMLYEIKRERYYEAGWESWDEYRQELKMSEASVSKLLRIYELFVLHYQFTNEILSAAGGWSTVAELLPVISPENTPKKRVQELLGIVTSQTRSDARKTILEVKRGKPCLHESTHKLVLECCDSCPERWNVTEAK